MFLAGAAITGAGVAGAALSPQPARAARGTQVGLQTCIGDDVNICTEQRLCVSVFVQQRMIPQCLPVHFDVRHLDCGLYTARWTEMSWPF